MTSKKNFLFTSAGDNTNFDSLWINDNMNYDIYVIYYVFIIIVIVIYINL